MRRTKDWWAALDQQERREVVNLERADAQGSRGTGWNLPPGYNDCPFCSTPSGGGLCRYCLRRLIALLRKADGALTVKAEEVLV